MNSFRKAIPISSPFKKTIFESFLYYQIKIELIFFTDQSQTNTYSMYTPTKYTKPIQIYSKKNNTKRWEIEGTSGWGPHCRSGKRGENDPWVSELRPTRAPELETLRGSSRNRDCELKERSR